MRNEYLVKFNTIGSTREGSTGISGPARWTLAGVPTPPPVSPPPSLSFRAPYYQCYLHSISARLWIPTTTLSRLDRTAVNSYFSMSLPSLSETTPAGGCHCGALTYTTTSLPAFSGYCHCAKCQKLTGPYISLSALPMYSHRRDGNLYQADRSSRPSTSPSTP